MCDLALITLAQRLLKYVSFIYILLMLAIGSNFKQNLFLNMS